MLMKTLKTYKQLFEQTVDIPYIFKTFFIKDDWVIINMLMHILINMMILKI